MELQNERDVKKGEKQLIKRIWGKYNFNASGNLAKYMKTSYRELKSNSNIIKNIDQKSKLHN